MLNRSNALLIVLLAIQIALIAVSALVTGGTESREVTPLLAAVDVTAAREITIVDDLGEELTFARGDEGWTLPAADDYPVDGLKVDELLTKVADLDTSRLVATNPANFTRLAVAEDDFRRRLSIVVDGAESVMYLGGSGGADTVYARRNGEDRVYLGRGLSAWGASTQVSAWIDTNYVSVPQEDVLGITLVNANGSYVFTRDGESWTYEGLPEGEAFEDTMMPNLLRNATSIRMVEPLGLTAEDTYGMDSPQATVEVLYRQIVEQSEEEADAAAEDDSEDEGAETNDDAIAYREMRFSLIFGARQEDGNIALKSSEREYYVAARDFTLEAFAGLRHEDLIRAPEVTAEETSIVRG